MIDSDSLYIATYERDLNQHIQSVHEGKTTYKCHYCDYKAKHKGTLSRHKLGTRGVHLGFWSDQYKTNIQNC